MDARDVLEQALSHAEAVHDRRQLLLDGGRRDDVGGIDVGHPADDDVVVALHCSGQGRLSALRECQLADQREPVTAHEPPMLRRRGPSRACPVTGVPRPAHP